ncbi:aminoglycoside phosphotransferase family protein [Roseibium sp. FZY0029]|uniref:aminoglycoside phosphotransferase family protein n=1 Tax=Roseibium sp. FZY0029 TaxID=3116647 RepID=UPI002EA64747|nr:aminoglycoside phosphotransferase family protein [Roseibium sp. FZY0029]
MADRFIGGAIPVPASLDWLKGSEAGRSWLEKLPALFETACDQFGLTEIGHPFSGGNVSLVVPVKRGAEDVVLKLQYPDPECRHEAEALRRWNGRGAVRLLNHAPDLDALLLERCWPGRFLADDTRSDRLGILADLLRLLTIPAGEPFTRLADEAARWRNALDHDWMAAGKPCDRSLVDAALAALQDLSDSDGAKDVLLHQDLHGHNILSAGDDAWLAIDPKPLVGDPAFALSPIVRSFEFGHSKTEARYRLDRLSEELELDRERARLWTIGQTMAWAFSSSYAERHFDTVRWLLVKD